MLTSLHGVCYIHCMHTLKPTHIVVNPLNRRNLGFGKLQEALRVVECSGKPTGDLWIPHHHSSTQPGEHINTLLITSSLLQRPFPCMLLLLTSFNDFSLLSGITVHQILFKSKKSNVVGCTMKKKTNLRDRDDLSTRDKRRYPEVSFVRRFHCIPPCT